MKLKDFLKELEIFHPEMEIGIMINSTFIDNIHPEIIQVELDWDNVYVKAFNQSENNTKVIVIS